jgi:hypothetical protein
MWTTAAVIACAMVCMMPRVWAASEPLAVADLDSDRLRGASYCTKVCGGCKAGRCDVFGCSPGLYCCSGDIVSKWYGACCTTCSSCPARCAPAGKCDLDTGDCFACQPGYFHPQCDASCSSHCAGDGTCDFNSGFCECSEGWDGPSCLAPQPAVAVCEHFYNGLVADMFFEGGCAKLVLLFMEQCAKSLVPELIEFPVMAELIVGIFAWVCPTLTAVVGLLCVEFGDVALEAYAGQVESQACEHLVSGLSLPTRRLQALPAPYSESTAVTGTGTGSGTPPPPWPVDMTFNFTLSTLGSDFPTVGSVAYSRPQQLYVQRYTIRNATAVYSGGDFHNCTSGATSFVWNVTACQSVPGFQCSVPTDMFSAVVSGVLLNNTVFTATAANNTFIGFPSGAEGPLVVTYVVTDAGLPQSLLMGLQNNGTLLFNMTFSGVTAAPPAPDAFVLPKYCPQAPASGNAANLGLGGPLSLE